MKNKRGARAIDRVRNFSLQKNHPRNLLKYIFLGLTPPDTDEIGL